MSTNPYQNAVQQLEQAAIVETAVQRKTFDRIICC
jgi:hypothetical protein